MDYQGLTPKQRARMNRNPKSKIRGVKMDLLELADKFTHSEQLRFGEAVAVCISLEHMQAMTEMLKQDAKSLGEVFDEM